MNDSFQKHSSSWVSFSYISFGAAAFMLAVGLYMMGLAAITVTATYLATETYRADVTN